MGDAILDFLALHGGSLESDPALLARCAALVLPDRRVLVAFDATQGSYSFRVLRETAEVWSDAATIEDALGHALAA